MPRTSKKDQETQKMWEQRINRAKKVKQNWKDLFKVDMIRDYLDGKQWDTAYAEADWITVNNIYSHMKAQLPALYSADPYFYVKLAKSFNPDKNVIALYDAQGKVRASMLNYLKRELKMKQKNRLSIQDAMSAFGAAKVCYYSEAADNPDYGKPMTAENGEPMFDEDTAMPIMNPEKLPLNEQYRLERIHPDDILFDEDAGPLEDSWSEIYLRVRMTLDKAKKDPRYNNKALKFLDGKGQAQDEETKTRNERKKGGDIAGKTDSLSSKSDQNGKEPQVVVFWEIYRLKEKTWLTIAEGADIPVALEEPMPKGIEDHPFCFLMFTLRDDSPYPHPPLSPLIPLATEYNRARSDIQKHRKRFNRKYAASNQGIDDDNLSKFESGDDGTTVRVNGDARGAIAAVQDAQMDPMKYTELSYLKAEMVELAGHNSSESMGLANADSATQSAILDKRLEMKEGDSMSMVVDFVIEEGRKLDMLVQTHITKIEAVKVTGPEGDLWVTITPDDYGEIEGEYEYTVNVGATIPRMPHIERSSWMAFLTLLQGFPQLALSKRLLTKMAEMHHIEDESMINEIYEIAQKMMSGQIPIPGNSGSQPGQPEMNPAASSGGSAGGVQSLMKGAAAIGG